MAAQGGVYQEGIRRLSYRGPLPPSDSMVNVKTDRPVDVDVLVDDVRASVALAHQSTPPFSWSPSAESDINRVAPAARHHGKRRKSVGAAVVRSHLTGFRCAKLSELVAAAPSEVDRWARTWTSRPLSLPERRSSSPDPSRQMAVGPRRIPCSLENCDRLTAPP